MALKTGGVRMLKPKMRFSQIVVIRMEYWMYKHFIKE
jgi:hypothetical protein